MTPSRVVVDTSVLVSASLHREAGHREAAGVVSELGRQRIEIVVPALLIVELMSALSRNGFRAERVRELVAAYRAGRFTLTPVDLALAELAGDIALLHHVRGADCIYLALARELRLPLVTLDREQRERAPADVEVLTPEQALAAWFAKEGDRPSRT
jgi:predicted nucleic acid-binding protein